MGQFKVGQEIMVPCSVSPGPFSEQRIVTFESVNGAISGFIDADDIHDDQQGHTFVKGVVSDIHSNTIEVRVKGSFFTTNGLAVVPRERVAAA